MTLPLSSVVDHAMNHAAVECIRAGWLLCRADSASGHLLRRKGEVRDESCALLRWSRHAVPGIRRRRPQTHGADRDTADSLAPNGVLRPLWAHGLHSLPRLQGNVIKDYFLHYDESVSNNFVWSHGGKQIHFLNRISTTGRSPS